MATKVVMTTTFTEKQPSLRTVYGDQFDGMRLEQVKLKRDALYAYCTTCERWLPGSPYWTIQKSMGIHRCGTYEMYTIAL